MTFKEGDECNPNIIVTWEWLGKTRYAYWITHHKYHDTDTAKAKADKVKVAKERAMREKQRPVQNKEVYKKAKVSLKTVKEKAVE